MKNHLTIFILLFLCSPSLVQAQNLDGFLKKAAKNNPDLQARYALFEASIERIAQVHSLPNPTLSIGYFINPVETRVGPQQAKINLTQMFPWFGTLATKEDVAALQAEAKYQEFLHAKNELYYNVKKAWYTLYELNQLLKLQKENYEILISFKQLSLANFKNGKNSMVDVIRSEIAIDHIETKIKLLEDKKQPLITHFNLLLNRADTTSIQIPDTLPLILPLTDYHEDSLLTQNALLEAYDFKIESAVAQGKLARKQGSPKFGVGFDYVFVGDRVEMNIPDNGKNAFMPMVTMSLPIHREKYKSAVKEALLIQSSLSASKTNYSNNLRSTYEITWYELRKAIQLIELYRNQIAKSHQIISLLLQAYTTSGKEFDEILRTQQELLEFQIAEATAVKDYYTALAKLDYITSKK